MSTAFALAALILAAFCSVFAWSLSDAPAASSATLTATGLALIGAAVGTVSLRRTGASAGVVRWFVYAIALAVIGQIVFGGRFALGAFLLRLGASIGVAGLALPARERFVPMLRRTPFRVLELLLGSVLILGFGAELGARIFSWAAPSPLFERPATTPAERIAMHELRSGTMRFGFPVSPDGFYDDPFRRPDGDRAVLVVGGSAGVGIVPHWMLYTTVAERNLPDTVVWNCSVQDTGPAEYRRLLDEVGLPLAPDRAIVAIEVADDFRQSRRFGEDSPVRDALASWLDARNVMLAIVPERLGELFERRRSLGRDPRADAFEEQARVAGEAAIEQRFPWTLDPSLEEPTWSESDWLARTRRQVEDLSAVGPDAGLFRALDACRADCASKGVPFALLVLPAAWQVDDALWRNVAGELRADARDRPQTLLAAWAARNAVPVLDVLPYLRAAPRQADGVRHLFHLRDDRLNTRGNRLVGEALAGFVEKLRKEQGR